MTAAKARRRPAAAFIVPRPPAGWRGRLAGLLYRLARWSAGTTPCPTCQLVAQRIGAGGRGAERRAWREAWGLGRRV